MDFFEQLDFAQQQEAQTQEVDLARMREDWSLVFFGSEPGRRVFSDMLMLSDYFGSRFTGNSKQFFLEGTRYFVSQIIKFCGLDTLDGLHRILSMQAQAQRRENHGG